MGYTVDTTIGNNTHDKLQRPTAHVTWKYLPFKILVDYRTAVYHRCLSIKITTLWSEGGRLAD